MAREKVEEEEEEGLSPSRPFLLPPLTRGRKRKKEKEKEGAKNTCRENGKRFYAHRELTHRTYPFLT